jgi:hypothetical protein
MCGMVSEPRGPAPKASDEMIAGMDSGHRVFVPSEKRSAFGSRSEPKSG